MAQKGKSEAVKAKKQVDRSRGRNFDYPLETKGSRLAAQLRQQTNHLNAQERQDLFRRGMQIIYGGITTEEKPGPGH